MGERTSGHGEWARRLAEWGRSEELAGELGHWLEQGEDAGAALLPTDADGGPDGRCASRSLTVELGERETAALLGEANRAYRTRPEEIALTALAWAIVEWTGRRGLLVEMRSDGRDHPFAGLDLGRTVGCFTSRHPLLLRLDGEGPADALRSVKERARAVPGHGLGYGALRCLGPPAARERLRGLPRPGVGFTFAGPAPAPAGCPPWSAAAGPPALSPPGAGPVIEVTASVAGGRLRTRWDYRAGLHRDETVARLAGRCLARLRELIEHCLAPGAGGYTPSDFPLAGLDAAGLDRLARLVAGIDEAEAAGT